MNDTLELISIGKIEKTFGVKGEVRVRSLTDVPGRFEGLNTVKLVSSASRILETAVRSVRADGESYIVGFEALTTPEEAALFRGGLIQIPRTASPTLPAGLYYECDLIGMRVQDETGSLIGTLEEILDIPQNNIFVIRKDGHEALIPARKDVVVSVDVESQLMIIRPIEGLMEFQHAL